mgnify:CR=1 FL=1
MFRISYPCYRKKSMRERLWERVQGDERDKNRERVQTLVVSRGGVGAVVVSLFYLSNELIT